MIGQLHGQAALPLEKEPPRYPLCWRLGEHQNLFGRYGEPGYFDTAGNRTSAVQFVAHCYTDWAVLTPETKKRNINKEAEDEE
jgi:hypothetical protein